MDYLQDINFLKKICSQHTQSLTARLTALNFNEVPQYSLIGKITDGTINLDGTSALQRTCSLSLTLDKKQYPQINMVLESKIKIEIGIVNNTNEYLDFDIIWFPMGIFYLTSLSVNETTTTYNISLQGKDKMCKLTGDIGGTFNDIIDFGKITLIDEEGNSTDEKLEISEIIKNLIHTYGQEAYSKIFIYDLEDYGLRLMSYAGDEPLYIIFTEQNDNYEIINYIRDGEYKVYKSDNNGNKTTEEISLAEIEDNDFFISKYNMLNEKNKYGTFYLTDNDNTKVFIKKCEYGDILGTVLTNLVYDDKELIASPGENVKSILDKIMNMLQIYEYFYDVNGNFIFKEQDQYVKINSFLNPSVSYTKPDFSFVDNELIISSSENYNLTNVKNDYTIYGERKSAAESSDSQDIFMRIAIDEKPKEYTSIYIDEDRFKILTKNYGDFFPKINGETDSEYQNRLKKDSILYVALNEQNKNYQSTTNIKYVDWREVLYQMAQDYKNYNYLNEFPAWLEESNPIYQYGTTGYERYYTDIDKIWRTLYQTDDDIVLLNEELSPYYNYYIKNSKQIISDNLAGLKIFRYPQLQEVYYGGNCYDFNWNIATINNNEVTINNNELDNYKILYLMYRFVLNGLTNTTYLLFNYKHLISEQSSSSDYINYGWAKIARFLERLDYYDVNEADDNEGKIFAGLKSIEFVEKDRSIKLNYHDNEKYIFNCFNADKRCQENHLIIWALAHKLLWTDNYRIQQPQLIKNGNDFETDNMLIIENEAKNFWTYANAEGHSNFKIKPLFYYYKYNENEKKQNKEIYKQIKQNVKKKGLERCVDRSNTFRVLLNEKIFSSAPSSSDNNSNSINALIYDTKMKDDDFLVYDKVFNQETKTYDYLPIGSCQQIINNNYRILKQLYWYAAARASDKDYFIKKDRKNNTFDTYGEAATVRLLAYNFSEVPSRYEEIHNTSWLLCTSDLVDVDSRYYDLTENTYYDLTHLYRQQVDEKDTIISMFSDSKTNDQIYIPITEYPKNEAGDSLTNLEDFAKDKNQLMLWAQAYGILYKKDKNIDPITNYNKYIIEDPSHLYFWFDFLDTSTFCQDYSISKIGPREYVKKETSISLLESPIYFDNILLDYTDKVSNSEGKISEYFKSAYSRQRSYKQTFRIGELDIKNLMATQTSEKTSIADAINNQIYNHTYMTQTVNITAIPQYFLQPNSLITVVDDKNKSEYVISRLSFSLRPGGTMNIQGTKLLSEALQLQDIRKEIING